MVSSVASVLDSVADRIERARSLDPAAEAVIRVMRKLFPDGPARAAASGTPIGHPLHPALVAVPIGSWVAATYLDVTAGDAGARAAQRLVGLGNLSALPTATCGLSDWMDTTGAERRVGLVHALLNFAAFGLFTGSWLARRRGNRARGIALSLAGSTLLAGSGWLGAHLTYALGVGVDTTAFQHRADEWVDVVDESAVREGEATSADAHGVPVLLTRVNGRIVAIADRCTHRGAPLHDGELADGCVTCPWHHSRYRLVDGAVERGPATRPQPVYEVRVASGRIAVRATDEQRALRTNPIGV